MRSVTTAKVADECCRRLQLPVTNNGAIYRLKKTALIQKLNINIRRSISEDIIVIPADTELIIELIDEIATERAREGDVFKARVVSPNEISGAIIEGRIDKIQDRAESKRRSELLAFI